MRSFEWPIEDIVAAFPSLSLDHYAVKAVAMMKHAGMACDFLVELAGFHLDSLEGETQFVMNVVWNRETSAAAERMERTEQRAPIVEGAASPSCRRLKVWPGRGHGNSRLFHTILLDL